MQLRRGKATDWHAMVHETLDSFASPHYFPEDVKTLDRVMIKVYCMTIPVVSD